MFALYCMLFTAKLALCKTATVQYYICVMYIYMCVLCIYIYMCYVYIYICVMYIYIYVCVYACTHVRMYACSMHRESDIYVCFF